ncbi:MAG: methyl-accepting chemotaxis protein [Halodesulfovibrio sp.]
MQLTVAQKMISGFTALLLLMSISTLVLINALKEITIQADRMVQENIPLSELAAAMKLSTIDVQQWLTDVSATHNPDGYKDAADAAAIFRAGVLEFKTFASKEHDEDIRNRLPQLEKAFDELEATGKRMAEAYVTQGIEAGNVIMEDFDARTEALAAAIDPLRESIANRSRTGMTEIVSELQTTLTTHLALLGISLAFGIFISLLISRSILRQLGAEPQTVASMAASISRGDFTIDEWRTQGSKSGLFSVMLDMALNLKRNFEEIAQKTQDVEAQKAQAELFREEADKARHAAEQSRRAGLIQSADEMEDLINELQNAMRNLGAEIEQVSAASRLQSTRNAETASAMEEMNNTVLDVARSASEAAENAESARTTARSGASIVTDVVKAITEVKTRTEGMKKSLGELGVHVDGIGQIMNVISDIADQTNLLALNAAIEAARAGEAGRGFAVVADEVRKLAEKTMTATDEVSKAILSIQDSSRSNIAMMDDAASSVTKSTGLADRAGDELSRIVDMVQSSSDQIRAIASASEEQSATSREINRAIESISAIAADTTQGMQNAEHSLSSLAGLITRIQKTVEHLRSEGSGGH